MDATAKAHAVPSVTGYLDAVTGSRIFGWAWDPRRPGVRIAIRIEARGEIVSALVADQPRDDLAANGVGDGRHAFDVPIPEGTSAGEFRVLAVCPETGDTVELRARGAVMEAVLPADTQAMLQALIRSQRVLHRNVQAVMMRLEQIDGGATRPSSDETGPPPLSQALEELREQVKSVEVFMVRADEALRDQAAAAATLRAPSVDKVGRALSGLAALLAGAAMLAAALH
jgi:hypothetical protein